MTREDGPAEPPSANRVLAAYGTLAPGESNFAVVADLQGTWYRGWVRGHRGIRRTGRYRGFPAFVPDPDGDEVPVAVLVSEDLPAHWYRLDEFEGPGYERVVIDIRLADSPPAPWPACRGYVYESIEDF